MAESGGPSGIEKPSPRSVDKGFSPNKQITPSEKHLPGHIVEAVRLGISQKRIRLAKRDERMEQSAKRLARNQYYQEVIKENEQRREVELDRLRDTLEQRHIVDPFIEIHDELQAKGDKTAAILYGWNGDMHKTPYVELVYGGKTIPRVDSDWMISKRVRVTIDPQKEQHVYFSVQRGSNSDNSSPWKELVTRSRFPIRIMLLAAMRDASFKHDGRYGTNSNELSGDIARWGVSRVYKSGIIQQDES